MVGLIRLYWPLAAALDETRSPSPAAEVPYRFATKRGSAATDALFSVAEGISPNMCR
jgi:hypothetical protein